MERIDITDIRHPDASFDAICCGRVLERVPDDRRAMAELRRVLKPSGWAVLLASITRERTVEENLDLFRRMRAGEFPDGSKALRAKIDMANPNMLRPGTVLKIPP